MKAKPLKLEDGTYTPCDVAEATHVQLHAPGPYPNRMIPVIQSGPREGTPCWTWNGDTEKPTLRPSLLTRGSDHMVRCHSFVTDGMMRFLGDCTHDLKGQTVPLLDVEED